MAHDAIRRTLATYCQLLDDGRFDEWVEVFTEDVALAVMGQTAHGRDAVRAFIEPVQGPDVRGRHMLSEPLIVVDPSGDRATVTTDYCFLARDLTVMSAGRYHDVLVRDPGDGDGWRIARREIVFLGDEPQGVEPATAPGEAS
jgi:3-phenylpropionate/cinnamic acid dioxygenase small subunit